MLLSWRSPAIQGAMIAYEETLGEVENALQTLRDVRSEYEEWHGNMPENLLGSPLGEKLQAIVDIDLDVEAPEFEEPDFSEIESAAQEALSVDLPLGFGRD